MNEWIYDSGTKAERGFKDCRSKVKLISEDLWKDMIDDKPCPQIVCEASAF